MNEYVSDIDIGGLMRRVLHEPNPAVQILEARGYSGLVGTQVAEPAQAAYIYTPEQAPQDLLARTLYAVQLDEDDKTGRAKPLYIGPWYLGPAAIQVVSGAIEIGVADMRAPIDRLAPAPTFAARGLFRAGSSLEVVSQHTWIMLRPHIDTILDIVFGVPTSPPKGRKLPVRKFDRFVNTLKRG